MRKLTDSEQKMLSEARREYEPEYVGYTIEELAGFDSGFITGLDHRKVEIDALKLQIKARDAFLRKIGIDSERIKADGIDMGIAD